MSKTVEFLFDVGSPYTYLAYHHLPRIVQAHGATIVWTPVLLGGIFQATGNSSPAEVPAKGRYSNDDLQRWAQAYGVPFQWNPHFPINTLALMRAVTGMQMREPARFLDFTRTVFESIWLHALNMNDPAVVAQVLQQAGYAPDAVLALSADPQVKAQLKAVTDEAVARGVFGAPTMFVGDQMFWGQDRLDWVREALAAP